MAKKLSLEEAEDLLKRYRAGQCTEREIAIIDEWYQSLDIHNEGTSRPYTDASEGLKMEMLDRINLKIGEAESDEALATESGRRPRAFFGYDSAIVRRMAAVLVVGISLGTFLLLYHFQNAADRSISDADTSFVPRTLDAKKASTLYLADGSVVWLKKGSTLEYPEIFQGDTREVQLTGEAFFDVAKNPDKPFIIHSGNFTTRVVGTSFNIRAYRSDDSAEVVVVTGRVVVSVNGPTSKKGSEVILHPNQRAVYSKKTHTLVESGAPPEAAAVAADMHKLAFDETRLSDILRVLNATYDVHITVSSENMNNCVITADLTNADLEFAMIILAKAINATYSISGKDILLRGNGCGLQ